MVTGDALHAQHASCQQIVEAGGDYLFIVKGNQPTLKAEIECLFEEPKAAERMRFFQQTDQHADRTEVRQVWVSAELGTYLRDELGWVGAAQVLKVRRQVLQKGQTTEEERYAFTSLSVQKADAQRLSELVRGHWRIENRLHYVRDVTLGEDANQTRTKAAPQIMAALRNVVLNLLRAAGYDNIAAALRQIAWKQHGALILLGCPP